MKTQEQKANEQAARAAYDAVKKCIAAITGDTSVIDGMNTQHNIMRALEAGLAEVFDAARSAWWNAQCQGRNNLPKGGGLLGASVRQMIAEHREAQDDDCALDEDTRAECARRFAPT